MTKSAKIVYLVFGVITAIIVVCGLSFMVITVFAGKPISEVNDTESPYTSYFFFSYSAINFIFLVFLGISSFRLFKFNPKGISLLKLTLKLELLYWLIISLLWLLPKPFGMSAAGATGIGNMGISPQIFIAYPITGLVALWILKPLVGCAPHKPYSASPL
jgi:hypothetical protein